MRMDEMEKCKPFKVKDFSTVIDCQMKPTHFEENKSGKYNEMKKKEKNKPTLRSAETGGARA